MQTFLPYPDFKASAQALDWRRLGKQRVEALQILRACRSGSGWSHHPACKMWKGFETALTVYMNEMIHEWIRRGYRNNMVIESVEDPVVYPPWLGNEAFHLAHQSNLIRKDPKHYRELFGPNVPDDLPYIWPK